MDQSTDDLNCYCQKFEDMVENLVYGADIIPNLLL